VWSIADINGRAFMLRIKAAVTLAALGTAAALAAGPASAASGWTIVSAPPTGQNANLQGVSAVSDSDAWAVGSTHGAANTGIGSKVLIDNWNGTAWSQVATPATPGNTATLVAVSASSATDAWAVGHTQVNKSGFAPLALHGNGTAWSVSPSAATALAGQIADGVADIGPTDAYAIGGGLGSAHSGLVAQWNGTTWTRVTVPPPNNNNMLSNLNAISADGPNDVWIVGTFLDEISPTFFPTETYSLHWNGTAWSVVPMPLINSSSINAFFHFNAIKANSPTDVWAVGDSGVVDGGSSTLIEHWNGTAWSIVPSPSPGSDDLLSGVTTSNAANDVWAVGSDVPAGATQAQTLTLNWNGTAWTTVASPDAGSPSVLNSVSTNPGAAIVWAAGQSGASGSFNPLVLQNG
jgi:hypothetical protein